MTLTYPGHPIFTNSLARLLSAAPDDGVRDGLKALAVLKTLPEEQWRMDGGEAMAMTLAELEFYDDAARWQREGMANATQAGRDDLAQRMAQNLRFRLTSAESMLQETDKELGELREVIGRMKIREQEMKAESSSSQDES